VKYIKNMWPLPNSVRRTLANKVFNKSKNPRGTGVHLSLESRQTRKPPKGCDAWAAPLKVFDAERVVNVSQRLWKLVEAPSHSKNV
jgi:hypothetical protein